MTILFSGLTAEFEYKTYDYRMRLRENQEIYQNLILLNVDDSSMNNIGRWPWNRSVHAELLDILSANGAGTILYDILFSQPAEKKGDDLLVQATANAGRVFYPVGFEFSGIETGGVESNSGFDIIRPFGLGKLIGENKLLSASRMAAPMEKLISVSKGLGHISSNRDSDGVIRRVPIVVKVSGELFPSIALATAMDFLDVKKDALEINPNRVILKRALFPEEEKRRDITIPVSDTGMMLINYPGMWGETFYHIPVNKIMNFSKEGKIATDDFKNKLLVISNAASGFDIKPVPVEKSYPGGAIHASIINTILTENFLIEAGLLIKFIIISILGIVGVFVGRLSKWHIKFIFAVLSVLGYIFFANMAFSKGIVLDLITPAVSVVAGLLSVSIYQVQDEKKKNKELYVKNIKIEDDLKDVNERIEGQDNKIKRLIGELSLQQSENSRLYKQLSEEIVFKEELELQKVDMVSLVIKFDFDKLQKEAKAHNIITSSTKLLEAFELVKKISETDHPVFLFGESGTGKELFAEAIHNMSKRQSKSLVRINVANLNSNLADSALFGHKKGAFTGADKDKPGFFKEADSGTLFLDEVGKLDINIQPKLLRVLQNKEIAPVGSSKPEYVDVRLITATDASLPLMVENGEFSHPLWERINVYPITLPPLRERVNDIPDLIKVFIERHSNGKNITGISDDALKLLCKFQWPGNVRQLENVTIRALINTDHEILQIDDIRFALTQGESFIHNTSEVKKNKKSLPSNHGVILDGLRSSGFAINQASELLGMGRNTLTDNFKGICFNYLVKNSFDTAKAASEIAGSEDLAGKVEKKIITYKRSIEQLVKGCIDSSEAKKECRRKWKNIPNEYFEAINVIVEKIIKGDNT